MVSGIIRVSFRKQAELLGLTEAEHPRYVAFETEAMAEARIHKTDVKLLYSEEAPTGTVGFSSLGEVGSIERLAVLPGCRGHGYGQIMLEHAEKELFLRGCRTIHLAIVARFERLQRYYEDLGYHYFETKTFPSLPFEVMYVVKTCPFG